MTTADASPLDVSADCCGGAAGLVAGASLVLVEEGSTRAWVFDLDRNAWRQIDDRADAGFVLGSGFVNGQLVVINSADRIGEDVSVVASLDLSQGTWSTLDPLPKPISVGDVSVSDGRLVVAGTRQDSGNNIIGDSRPSVFDYADPALDADTSRDRRHMRRSGVVRSRHGAVDCDLLARRSTSRHSRGDPDRAAAGRPRPNDDARVPLAPQ